MKLILLQRIHYVLDCGVSMVPVLCHQLKIQYVLNAQLRFCEGNPLARQMVSMSRCENWNNHTAKFFHLHTTPLHHLAIWLAVSSEARMWMDHCTELFEVIDPQTLFEEGCSSVHQMLKHSDIDCVMNIKYDTSCQIDALHIVEDTL